MRRLFLILSLLLPVTLLVSSASMAQTKLEATIFFFMTVRTLFENRNNLDERRTIRCQYET